MFLRPPAPKGWLGGEKCDFHHISPNFMKWVEFTEKVRFHHFSPLWGVKSEGKVSRSFKRLPFKAQNISRNWHSRNPLRRESAVSRPEMFFARNPFCAEKCGFRENAEFHEKGGSGLEIHQFGVGIHRVSWILRFRVFPSRKNLKFYEFTYVLCKLREISQFSWNFM